MNESLLNRIKKLRGNTAANDVNTQIKQQGSTKKVSDNQALLGRIKKLHGKAVTNIVVKQPYLAEINQHNVTITATPHDFLVQLRNSPAVSLESTFELAALCLQANEHVTDKGDNGYHSLGVQWQRFFNRLSELVTARFYDSENNCLLPCDKENQIDIVSSAQIFSVITPSSFNPYEGKAFVAIPPPVPRR